MLYLYEINRLMVDNDVRKFFNNVDEKQETAVLVAVQPQGQRDIQASEYLDELEFLAETAGVKTLKKFTQKLEYPDPRTYIGKGKLEEVRLYVEEHKADTVIFDDELSPSQIRNVERELNCKILDRANLILDIFASRAKSKEGRLQVGLAQMQFLLPRLAGQWSLRPRLRPMDGHARASRAASPWPHTQPQCLRE